MKTQMNHYWEAHRKASDLNAAFLDMVSDGMTRKELQVLVELRPSVYGRFENWLEKLPN